MKALRNKIKEMVLTALLTFAAVMYLGLSADTPFAMTALAAEAELQTGGQTAYSVSDNSVPSVSDNSVPVVSDDSMQEEPVIEEEPMVEEITEPALPDPTQMQTINYNQGILTDWTQIAEALRNLTPEALTNPDSDNKTLVFQLQNVKSIPADIKDSLSASDGSGYTKVLQCNLDYGVDLVLSGAEDISGFTGIANASVVVTSENRGKKSVATTVRFESHQSLGAVVGLQLNLPKCGKGTKVSVYAETVTIDEQGNAVVGENVCIGNTKADEQGNVAVPIQTTANYMFVYKGEKE